MNNTSQKMQNALELLKLHYGYDKFRPGQEEAIRSLIEGRSTVVIMPTGGGKSLIYQLPALVMDGVTLVVSPLISLMKDQVDSLTKIGIPATFINSAISQDETLNRIEAIKNNHYKLLYIAPERFYSQDFLNALSEIKVDLFAIDEAHCISQWGHDFRPSYTKLNKAIEMTGNPTIAALTATATPEVKEDIIKQLNLKDPKVLVTGFARPNLQFGVIHASDNQKPDLIIDAINSVQEGSGIIYTGTRSKADDLAERLHQEGIEAYVYHAGMDPESRKWVQNDFMNGKAKVIVATNAFGLGIDKKDIRFVIHFDMPGTVEAYYQEAGRAGRDGKASFCLMFYHPKDRYLREFFIKGDNPPPEVITEIYELLLEYESDSILITYSAIGEKLSEQLPDMAIGTCLKILEKEGYISRPNEKNALAFFKLTASFPEAYSQIGKRAKKQAEILEKLEQKYKDDILNGWNFNTDEVAEMISEKKESLVRVLKNLSQKNLAEYAPPFKGTEIKILKRIDPLDLQIDYKALKEKQKNAYSKLDQIENYVYSNDCRQKYILDYFNDLNSNDCGKCDNCLTGQGYQRKHQAPNKELEESGKKKRFERFKKDKEEEYDVTPPDDKPALSTKLTQLETMELFNKGLGIKEISSQRDLAEETIVNHLTFLIEKGILNTSVVDKLVDKKKQKKILDVAEEIGDEKLKPIKEQLGDEISYQDIKLTLTGRSKK